MLLILNKVAVTYIPAPSFILTCQLASTALFVKGMASTGAVEAEPLSWSKSKKFALIVFGFIGTLFSSVTSLKVRPMASQRLGIRNAKCTNLFQLPQCTFSRNCHILQAC